MPGKSKQSKGKHPHNSRKSKAIQRQSTVTTQRQAVTEASPVADTAAAGANITKAAGAPARAKAPQYPYIAGELRRIGILAAIILVVLIILAIVL